MKDEPMTIPPAHAAPDSSYAEPPESAEDLYTPAIGQTVRLRINAEGDMTGFEVVAHLGSGGFRARILGQPGPGRRWDLRGIDVNTALLWGRTVLRVRGRTRTALQLQPVGFLEELPSEAGEEASS